MTPYKEGYEAYPTNDCHYEQYSTAWNAWWDGYSQAELLSAYYGDNE